MATTRKKRPHKVVPAEPHITSITVEKRKITQEDLWDALDAIYILIDGTEWSPHTMNEIAEVMKTLGFIIRNPV